jgi:hypothetical protein
MARGTIEKINKKWVTRQIRNLASLKSRAAVQRLEKNLLEYLEDEETRHYTARDMTYDEVTEIFGLKESAEPWDQLKEKYDTPLPLIYNLAQLKKAHYDKTSEAYGRIVIDYLIVPCMVKHQELLLKQSKLPTNQSGLPANDPTAATSPILEQSKLPTDQSGLPANDQTAATSPILEQSKLPTDQSRLPANDPTAATSSILEQSKLLTDNPYDQTAAIAPILDQATEIAGPSYIAPTTPLVAPKSTFRPLPIKVFTEMGLSVKVKRGDQKSHISGIADWTIGYGNRASSDDGAVLLAVEAKRKEFLLKAQVQLLVYLATIRQLRIQADKKNVMTQGFYSDGEMFRFVCIRNNGTVMMSDMYDIYTRKTHLKTVFNFLLGMLNTAAESSPNTSPAKPGPEQDERIEKFDQDVFVKVFKGIDSDNISEPISSFEDEMEEEELPDFTIIEE